jgi:hypothetical protein
MNVSKNPIALAAIAKHSEHVHGAGQACNPAKQAKAADPAVKGAAFGALVAQFAHAKHAPPAALPETTTPPAPTTETPPENSVDIVV